MFTDTEPGADPRLAAVFSAARAPAELPVPGEAAALAAYRRSTGKSWFAVRLGARPAQLVAAALFGGFVVAGGVATAATGSLPLVNVHQHHATTQQTSPTDDADTGSAGDDETTSATDLTDTGGPGTEGHPGVLGSVAKGVETCTEASGDTCQAGQHGKALTAHDAHAPALPAAATRHQSAHASAPGDAAVSHRHLAPLRATPGTSHRRG